MAEELQSNPTWMLVVAAAIVDGEGRLLLRLRPLDKQHGGLWEFPGGKVESGETPGLALVREIEEELALMLDSDEFEPCCFAQEPAQPGRPPIVILLYTVRRWTGEPHAEDGAAGLVRAGRRRPPADAAPGCRIARSLPANVCLEGIALRKSCPYVP